MNPRLQVLGVTLVVAGVLAGCAGAAPTVAPVIAPATTESAVGVTEPTASRGQGYGNSGAYGASPATQPAAAGNVTIAVADSTLGKILVDGRGMTLYILTADKPNESTCYAACAQTWPPLPAVAGGKLGAGVDASLLGTSTRTDGSLQATYNGMPLYNFGPDAAPGDTLGQGKNGVWFVVSPTGSPIK